MSMLAKRESGHGVMRTGLNRAWVELRLVDKRAAKLLESGGVRELVKHQPHIAPLVGVNPVRPGAILAKGPQPLRGGRREERRDGGVATAINIERQEAAHIVGGCRSCQGDVAGEMAVNGV